MDIRDKMKYILQYPYGCVEETLQVIGYVERLEKENAKLKSRVEELEAKNAKLVWELDDREADEVR